MGCLESKVIKDEGLEKPSNLSVYVANAPVKPKSSSVGIKSGKSRGKKLHKDSKLSSNKSGKSKSKLESGDFDDDELKKKPSISLHVKKSSSSANCHTNNQNINTSNSADNGTSGEDGDIYRHWQNTQTVAKYRTRIDARVTAKYEIKALIGRGNFSRVVRVEHKATRQPFAIKMIERDEGRSIFEAELAVLRRVRHRNVIQLVEVFETRDKVYMVMELATGGELLDRIISKGFFTEADATRVLQMVLEGVCYLHSLGIAHRDLKPENLLYYHPGKDSKILITDFGLSHTPRHGDDVYMRTVCGTLEYIAPEILARRPYTHAIDMWAIGVITYILLSGRMPFDDDNRMRLFRKILRAKFVYVGEPWKDISPMAKDFIDHLLVTDPSQRLSATQTLRHEWIVSHAAGSSNKNLHRTISSNLLLTQARTTTTSPVDGGLESTRIVAPSSSSSTRSSGRSAGRRLRPEDVEELHRDPDLRAELSSLAGTPPG